MRVLLVGSGGREHALAWALARSPLLEELYVAPGNPGTARHGENLAVAPDDVPGLVEAARRRGVELVVVGPELPLAAGLTDALAEAGIGCFGPSRAAAALEASKAFAKELMAEAGVPTAPFRVVSQPLQALRAAEEARLPVVVKASGLAAGKGVVVCRNRAQAVAVVRRLMIDRKLGAAGETLVIEDCLEGEEASLLALTDGSAIVALLPAQDHKAAWEGDRGPNTGGMGAYAPAPVLSQGEVEEVVEAIMRPTLRAMARRGMPFRGLLYAGLMKTERGLQVLEFNARFGDPEAQAVLPLLESDLLELLAAPSLEGASVAWRPGACLTVVLAARGYPGSYLTGLPLDGLPTSPRGIVFHAGTVRKDGRLVSAGGRVLNATAWGDSLAEARREAYRLAEAAAFAGCFYRRDIGARALEPAGGPGDEVRRLRRRSRQMSAG